MTHFLELGSGTGFLACFLAQTGKDRTIWATDVGETDSVDDDGLTEEDDEAARDETDPTAKAKDVLRKGPIWGLRGNVDISQYHRLFVPPTCCRSTLHSLLIILCLCSTDQMDHNSSQEAKSFPFLSIGMTPYPLAPRTTRRKPKHTRRW